MHDLFAAHCVFLLGVKYVLVTLILDGGVPKCDNLCRSPECIYKAIED